MKTGEKIKKIRKLKGFSQNGIAELLCISQRAYSDIENNKTKIDLERLKNLGKIFNMDPSDILNFDEHQVLNPIFPFQKDDMSKLSDFENERQSYQQQIKHLEEEILFLRTLLHDPN